MPAILLEDPIKIDFTIIGRREWLRQVIPAEDVYRYQYIIVDRSEDLDSVESYLNNQIEVAWDTETTGSPERDKDGLHAHSKTNQIILFQIGTPKHTYLVDPMLLVLYPHFKRVMENPNVLKIGQNEIFDFKELLAKTGIHVVSMWCCMLAEQVLTAGLKGIKADLKSIVRRYKPYITISKETRDEFYVWSGKFTQQQLYYGARDVALLFRVKEQQYQDLIRLELMRTAQVEYNCIPVTAEMELGGLLIEVRIVNEIVEYNRKMARRLWDKIHKLYNEELAKRPSKNSGLFGENTQQTIDLASPQAKKEALARIGIEVKSTDSEELEMVDHEIGPLISKWMNHFKVETTYGDRLVKMIHPDTGKLHPRFLQMGQGEDTELDTSGSNAEKGTTATGRYSSNAQQFPKEKKVYDQIEDTSMIQFLSSQFADKIAALQTQHLKQAA